MAFKDWSETASDNDDADADINWAEGQAPSTVNGSARQMMAKLKTALGHIVSVKSYGATGDGTTDDYTAVNDAITAANGGGRVYFPPGRYKLGSELVLSSLSDVECVFLADATLVPAHADEAMTIAGCERLTFRGLRLDGSSMTDATEEGIIISSGSEDIKFYDCTAVSMPSIAFTLRVCDRVTIDGFWCLDMVADSSFLDSHEATNLVINNAHGKAANGVTNLDSFIDLKANTADSRNILITNISCEYCDDLVGFGTEINTGFVLENVIVKGGIANYVTYPIYIKPTGGGTLRNFHISDIWFNDPDGLQLKSGLRWEGFNGSGGTISNGYIQMRGRGSFAGSASGDRIAFHLGDGSNMKLDLEFESVDGTNDLVRAIGLRGDMDDVDLTFNIYGHVGTASLGLVSEGANADIGNIRVHDFTLRTVPSGSAWLFTTAATVSGRLDIYDGIVSSGNIQAVNDSGTGVNLRNITNFTTENSGSSEITSGNTTVVVTHGLAITPDVEDISITFAEQGTNDYGRWWVSNITSTQFTVNVSADPGASGISFGWRATYRRPRV